jgi:hypothetical protein
LRKKFKYEEEKKKGLKVDEEKKLLKMEVLKELNDCSHLAIDG